MPRQRDLVHFDPIPPFDTIAELKDHLPQTTKANALPWYLWYAFILEALVPADAKNLYQFRYAAIRTLTGYANSWETLEREVSGDPARHHKGRFLVRLEPGHPESISRARPYIEMMIQPDQGYLRHHGYGHTSASLVDTLTSWMVTGRAEHPQSSRTTLDQRLPPWFRPLISVMRSHALLLRKCLPPRMTLDECTWDDWGSVEFMEHAGSLLYFCKFEVSEPLALALYRTHDAISKLGKAMNITPSTYVGELLRCPPGTTLAEPDWASGSMDTADILANVERYLHNRRQAGDRDVPSRDPASLDEHLDAIFAKVAAEERHGIDQNDFYPWFARIGAEAECPAIIAAPTAAGTGRPRRRRPARQAPQP